MARRVLLLTALTTALTQDLNNHRFRDTFGFQLKYKFSQHNEDAPSIHAAAEALQHNEDASSIRAAAEALEDLASGFSVSFDRDEGSVHHQGSHAAQAKSEEAVTRLRAAGAIEGAVVAGTACAAHSKQWQRHEQKQQVALERGESHVIGASKRLHNHNDVVKPSASQTTDSLHDMLRLVRFLVASSGRLDELRYTQLRAHEPEPAVTATPVHRQSRYRMNSTRVERWRNRGQRAMLRAVIAAARFGAKPDTRLTSTNLASDDASASDNAPSAPSAASGGGAAGAANATASAGSDSRIPLASLLVRTRQLLSVEAGYPSSRYWGGDGALAAPTRWGRGFADVVGPAEAAEIAAGAWALLLEQLLRGRSLTGVLRWARRQQEAPDFSSRVWGSSTETVHDIPGEALLQRSHYAGLTTRVLAVLSHGAARAQSVLQLAAGTDRSGAEAEADAAIRAAAESDATNEVNERSTGLALAAELFEAPLHFVIAHISALSPIGGGVDITASVTDTGVQATLMKAFVNAVRSASTFSFRADSGTAWPTARSPSGGCACAALVGSLLGSLSSGAAVPGVWRSGALDVLGYKYPDPLERAAAASIAASRRHALEHNARRKSAGDAGARRKLDSLFSGIAVDGANDLIMALVAGRAIDDGNNVKSSTAFTLPLSTAVSVSLLPASIRALITDHKKSQFLLGTGWVDQLAQFAAGCLLDVAEQICEAHVPLATVLQRSEVTGAKKDVTSSFFQPINVLVDTLRRGLHARCCARGSVRARDLCTQLMRARRLDAISLEGTVHALQHCQLRRQDAACAISLSRLARLMPGVQKARGDILRLHYAAVAKERHSRPHVNATMMSAQPEPATHCGWYLRHENATRAADKGLSLARRDLYCELQAWQWLERAIEPEDAICGEYAAVVLARKIRHQRARSGDGAGAPSGQQKQEHSIHFALRDIRDEDIQTYKNDGTETEL